MNVSSLAGLFVILGVTMIVTPGIILFKDGCRNEEDVIRWMMGKPLEVIAAIQNSINSGQSLILLGTMLSALPN